MATKRWGDLTALAIIASIAGGCIQATGLTNATDAAAASDLDGVLDSGGADMQAPLPDLTAEIPDLATLDLVDAASPPDLTAEIPDLATLDLVDAASPPDLTAEIADLTTLDLVDAASPPDLAPQCRSDADCATWQVCSTGKCTDWTPAQLAGLALWLDPDRDLAVQGGSVSAWLDQSGHRNTAAAVGQPTRTAAALAGHDAVHFDGASSLTIADAASLRWGNGAFTVEVVGRYTNPPTTGVNDYRYAVFYAKLNPSVAPYIGAGLFGNTNYKWLNCGFPVPSLTGLVAQVETCSRGGGVGSTIDNDSNWHVVGMHRAADGVTLSVRSDGVDRSTHAVPAVDISAVGFPAQIGGMVNGPQQLIGDIAEVVAISGNDSPADLARLEAYLAHKYGL